MENKAPKGPPLGGGIAQAVSPELCGAYRAHIETKIEDMETRIRWSVYLTSAGMGLVIILFQYYLAVMH